MRFDRIICVLSLILTLAPGAQLEAQRSRKTSSRRKTPTRVPARQPAPSPPAAAAPQTGATTGTNLVDERELYLNAARTAWSFVNRNYQPSTGLARAHDTYQYVTLWDVASALAATYCAHELGLLNDAIYNQRIQRALGTISTMDLFDGAAFNKSYDSKTGKMIDRSQRISARGYGWSVTDIGRLLTWLRIIAINQPQYATQ